MAALLLVVALLLSLAAAQPYVPRPVARTSESCPTGNTFVSIGDDNVANTDIHTTTTQAQANFLLTSVFNNTAPSTTISQLSFGILDNYQISTVALVRLALYSVSGTAMTRLGQSQEIMLYATGATTIYADLITPVTIQRGQYAIAVWSNTAIYTGINNVPTGMTGNSASLTYTSTSFPLTFTASTVMGTRAVKMMGCSNGQDPWVGDNINYYSFCFSGAYTTPSVAATTASSTVMATLNGVVAVNTQQTGSTSQGTWYLVTAGNARYQTVTYPATSTSFSAATTQPVRNLGAGGTFAQTSQRLYPSSSLGVDYYGISFADPQGTQRILQYQNNTFEMMLVSPGSTTTIQFVTGVFSATRVFSADVAFPTCSIPTQTYTPDTFSCPAGQVPVKYGDDEEYNAVLTVNTATSLLHANYMLMRPFTANIPGTTLYQLTWLVNANNPLNRVARIRLGLFTNQGTQFRLVSQTQEIRLWGTTTRTLLKANLLQPFTLVQDRNYSIGVIADSPIYTTYGSYGRTPAITTSTFGQLAPSATGFRTTATTLPNTLTTVLPVAANGCTTQTTTQHSFCSVFVYATYFQVYNGVLTTVGTQSDEKGTFRPVLSGTGTFNYTYTSSSLAPRIFPMTVSDYNLDADNRLYVAGNQGSPVNEFGIQFVVQQGPSNGLAVQLRSVYDPFSETFMWKESTQGYSTTAVSFLNPIISDFSITPYTGGPVPTCAVPPKPVNLVTPPSVARAQCPNLVNDMADTFGDGDVGNYAQHVDGTIIQGGRVYTQRFTADSVAVINQLAVGILQNADRPAAIQVRLGLYAQANNSLIAQTNEIVINQAVAQLINANLPFPVTIQSGQTYLIAIFCSTPLEVAHTGTATSPAMIATYGPSGLPTTFTSSGNDVTPSIAAYACVRATHSFCAGFQYYTPTRDTITYLYQGLIQTGPMPATNSWGTYLPIWAAAGRLIAYRRGPLAATQTITLFQFSQRPNTNANLYTSAANGKALDATGIMVQTTIGVDSNLQFNLSINKFDESFSFGSTLVESQMFFGNFSFSPLGAQYGIPSCGLGALPEMPKDSPPKPVCEDGEEIVTYGTGDQFTLSSNSQGINGLPANQIFLRQITTDGDKWSVISQLKFGMNVNPNTISTIRLGIYDNRMQFIAGTEDITFYNTNDYIATGYLNPPVYLAPGTVYYLSVWNQAYLYAGFIAGSGPSMAIPLENGVYNWPQQFVDTNPNSMRAIGGFGCTINGPPTPGSSSSSSTGNPFVSSSRFSSTAVSSSAASSSARSSSSSWPAVSSSATPSSTAGQSSTAAFVTSSPSSTGEPAPFPVDSSTKSGLSSGGVAGLVIGCVIGSNLIVMFCIWCFCLGGAAGKNLQHKQLEESKVGDETNDHEIEMETAT